MATDSDRATDDLSSDVENATEISAQNSITHAAAQKILSARAEALAKRRKAPARSESVEIVRFIIDGQPYAFEVSQLREVSPLSSVTPVPCCPIFLIGVINLRGQIIPLIDLRTFLSLPEPGQPILNKALIVEQGEVCVGFLADEVLRAEKIQTASIQRTLSTFSGLFASCLKGITSDRVLILDAHEILASPKLYQSHIRI